MGLKERPQRDYRARQNQVDYEEQEQERLKVERELNVRQEGPKANDTELSIIWVPIEHVFPMGLGIKKLGFNQREQPRKSIEGPELDALVKDFETEDQQVPATVRVIHERASGRDYGIIKGHRRLEAAKRSGKKLFLVRVISGPDGNTISDRAAYRLSILDDVHNVKHTPAERGASIAQLQVDLSEELREFIIKHSISMEKVMTMGRFESMRGFMENREETAVWIERVFERAAQTERRPKVQIEDLALMVGLGEKSIRNYLSQAGLTPQILERVLELKLSGRHLTALSVLKDATLQEKLLAEIVKKNLTGEDAEARAAEIKADEQNTPRPAQLPLRPLRALVSQTRKFAEIEVPQNISEEAKRQVLDTLDELEELIKRGRQKWG